MKISAVVCILCIVSSALVHAQDPYYIYNNGALQNGFQDWSWASKHSLNNTTRSHSGSGSCISWDPQGYEALYFHVGSTGPAFSSYAGLEFWVYVATSDTDFNVQINQATGGPAVKLSKLVASSSGIPAGQWVQAVFSFTDYPVLPSGSSLVQLYLQADGTAYPTVFVDQISLNGKLPPPPPTPPPNWDDGPIVGNVQATLDSISSTKPISPLVYGASFATDGGLVQAKYTINRNGGNAASRFNWEKSIHNTAADWFFENIAEPVKNESILPEGNSVDQFLDSIKSLSPSTKSLVTMNMIGFAPLDDRSTKAYSYSIKKYGPQTNNECQQSGNPSWCNPDIGNGILASNQQKILGDTIWQTTSKIVDETYDIAWMQHMYGRGTPPDFVALDNEPMLWSSTHFDVFPKGLTYNDLWNRTLSTSTALKKYNSNIKTLGPVVWGWCAYFWSAADGCTCGPDCQAHNSVPLLEWYLQQNCKYSSGNNLVVDYLDIHYYPQASGVQNNDESPTTLGHRFRAAKSLYNTGYVDESWINQQIYLVPRMKGIIQKNCPQTKFSISEFSFGPPDLASVALATAEALAIYGREGVDIACIWTAPDPGTKTESAFKLYTNFDGAGSNLVDGAYSITGNTTNIDYATIFGIYVPTKNMLYVLLFNKEPGNGRISVTAQITGLPSSVTTAQRFSFGKASAAVVARDNVAIANGKFSVVLSIFEATVLAIKLA